MEKTNAKSSPVVSSCTRVSSRLQANKQRAEKEELVRKRLKLLDENSDGRGKKRNGVCGNEDVEMVEKKKNPAEILGSNEEEKTGGEVVVANPGSGGGGDEVVKSASARAKETLRLFNKHYLHFVQEEETRCAKEEIDEKASKKPKSKKEKSADEEIDAKKKSRRPDLKAVKRMMETNSIMYPEKIIGDLPGINVGHQFYSRAEMVAIGFHSHWLNGIDFMGMSYKNQYPNHTLPLAVAIVLSGMYEDDKDNAEEVVYTGQGGHDLNGNKRQIKDQVMKLGNLGLKNCVEQSVPVRVIRGHKSASSYTRKVYTYDGLYNVVQYWTEKGISGFTVFKFRLRRVDGQPTLTTNQVQFINGRVPQSVSEIRGLVCEDLSNGEEKFPIPATNLVDDPPVPPPPGFTYCSSLQIAENIKLPAAATGCNCKGNCVDPRKCSCAKLNGSDFPYVHKDGGRLIEAKAIVFECGPNCGCGPDCVNRTSQRGIKYRLEVFRTPKKGWAVRSWDFIPSGAPICEYIGVLRRTDDMDNVAENNYIFEIDCLQTMKGIGGRERRLGIVSVEDNMDGADDPSSENAPEFCIDAGSTGNIARFINHSCEPNLFVQCVLSSHQDLRLARVMLFAADNIPPLQELTYDYGYILDSVRGPDGKIKQMACFCGAADCRKRLF
ncbi:histone-lysine N-methyltransferase, H3 lysine-9 specific SUVH4-like [Euphorbia lathyris]|uniref:histone-lysine N-methyltransferase, H3 lysine-9 specific SUVH4-like n=1 Tax=Euphorbia lathyris TaxID=212925 RepID=UPI0033144E31